MWHVRRVYMEGVGHPDARFDPLDVDFTDPSGDPADGVLWLENMGGKTSWVSLVFSTLRPDRREFLGSIRDNKRIDDYVGAHDTAHVAIEWQRLGPPSLFEGRPPRLVTGQVMQWRNRRIDRDNPGNLVRRYYSFVPTAELGYDTLPVRDDSGRRRSLRDFVDALGKALEGADALRPSDNQREWRRWLERRGLDPEVFRYQLLMNADEGAVAEQFKWEDGNSFIRWALPYIVDPKLPEQIAAAVDKVRRVMSQRDPLRLEKQFCDEVAGALEAVAGASELRAEVRRRLRASWDRAAELANRLVAGIDVARAEASRADERAREAAARAREISSAADLAARQRNEALICAADLTCEELERKLAICQADAAAWQRIVKAWDLTAAVIELREVELSLAQIEAELAHRRVETAPLSEAAERAGERLARKLTALRDRARDQVSAGEAEAARAVAAAEEAEAAEARAAAAETEAAMDEAVAGSRLAELDAALDRAIADGLLEPGESPEIAASRRTEALERRNAELAETRALAERRETELAEAEAALAAARAEAADAELAARRSAEGLAALDRDAGRVAGDADLIEAAQQNPFDPWHSPPEVLDRLRTGAEAAAADRLEAELAAAADRRAVAHLESESLLPPRPDVAKALARLEAAGIAAYSGWQVLRDTIAPDQRADRIAAVPALADGVLVRESADVDRAAALLEDAGLTFPIAVAPIEVMERAEAGAGEVGCMTYSTSFGPEPLRGRVRASVVSGAPALYDEDEAAAELEARRARLADTDQSIAACRQREEAARAAAARYEAFLSSWPAERVTELRAASEEARALAAAAAERAVDAAEIAETARRERDAAAAAIVELEGRVAAAERAERDTAELARRDGERPSIIAARDEAARARARLADKRAAARTEARQLRAAAVAARDSARAAERRRQQAAEDLRRLSLTPTTGGDEPADPPDVLTRALLEARRALEAARADDVLESERASKSAIRARRRAQIDRATGDVRDQARRLLAETEAQTEEQRAAEKESAERELERANQEVGKVGFELEAARALRQQRQVPERKRAPLESPPASAADADALAAELDSRAAALADQRAQLVAERDRLVDQSNRRGDDAARLEEAAGELAEELAARESDAGREWEPISLRQALPWRESVASAHAERRRASVELRELGDELAGADRARQRALAAVDRAVNSPEFAGLFVGAPLRERLVGDSDAVRGANAGDLAAQLRVRARSIERDLADIEEHRQTLTTMLVGQVRSTLQLLRQLQNQSRLPDGLDEWSGRTYLVIKHAELPADPEQLAARIDTVIDQICSPQTAARTDGLSLLWGGLRAGVASDFAVEILKPHKTLRADRVPVSEIRTFSGGQKITAALVLFAALTRMRELNLHRDAIGHGEIGATLILDNPIGKASAGTLIEVQRRVAERCGLQLIYTTGVSDLGALGAFTCVIRLDGKENLRTGAHHVTELERLVGGIRLVQRERAGA